MPRGTPQRLSKPTLRELQARDRKRPLKDIGVFDNVNKSDNENSLSDTELARSVVNQAARSLIDKQMNVETRDVHKIPIPKGPKAVSGFDVFTLSSPAGMRADTEKATVADWNARTNYGRRSATDTYGATALGGPYSGQSKVSKLLNIRKKAR